MSFSSTAGRERCGGGGCSGREMRTGTRGGLAESGGQSGSGGQSESGGLAEIEQNFSQTQPWGLNLRCQELRIEIIISNLKGLKPKMSRIELKL